MPPQVCRAAIPKQQALALDLAGRRVPAAHARHAPTQLTPLEHGEAELFHVRARARALLLLRALRARAARAAARRDALLKHAPLPRADARTLARVRAPDASQAISVATHGSAAAPLSSAVVEVSVILVAAGFAARLVHYLAQQTGMALEAQRRGGATAAAVTTVLADVGAVDSPAPAPAAAAEDAEAPPQAPSLLHAYFTRPASTLVWATAAAASARCVLRATAEGFNAGAPWSVLGIDALSLVSLAWRLALVACLTWAVQLSNAAALERAAERHPRHKASYYALRDAISRGTYFAAALAALSVLHVPLSAVLTFSGVGGVALGVGAQAAARNALSGAFLMLSHAIHEGDYVELVGKGLSGTVMDLSLTSTTLLSRDATTVSLPNGELVKTPLRNFTRARALAVTAEYAVPQARLAAVPHALARMEAFLAAHPDVEATAAEGRLRSAVSLGELRDGNVTLQARAYVATPGRSAAQLERIRREVVLGLGRAITAEAGLPLAPPTLGVVTRRAAARAPAAVDAEVEERPTELLPAAVPAAARSAGVPATPALTKRELRQAMLRRAMLRRRGVRFVAGRPGGGDTPAVEVLADAPTGGSGPHEDMGFSWRGGELEAEEPGEEEAQDPTNGDYAP